ncbi:PHD finger protein 7 isoform X2 [Lepeophtheirus salmonis]|uniref:PHD finger protein 7 isoform X2 n=1 Tax=Lepeophtheirus salmonis TaxID=72036 RepID=UPI001AEAC1AC|nr:PHD finger protein 7-like isoform X2 [Lepeophtheirus salmonis]
MTVKRRFINENLSEILDGDVCCMFCRNGVNPELGTLYEHVNASVGSAHTFLVHYFCLLFSSGLSQTDDEHLGIEGFLLPDIYNEWKRSKRLKCSYCLKTLASVGCAISNCHKSFHLPCAMKQDVLLVFKDTFSSYCKNHHPKQKIPIGAEKGSKECSICLQSLNNHSKLLWSPCCSSWAHKQCLSSYAASAGYFFKCPLCNDSHVFCDEMKSFGIYVPEQDASWEREPHAFEELAQRYGHCDVKGRCLCPQGRKHDVDYSDWEIILCRICGASGVHVKCGKLVASSSKKKLPEWTCELCHDVEKNLPVHHFHPVQRKSKKLVSISSLLKTISFRVSDSNDESILSLKMDSNHIISVSKSKKEKIPSQVTCFLQPDIYNENSSSEPSSSRMNTSSSPVVPILSKIITKKATLIGILPNSSRNQQKRLKRKLEENEDVNVEGKTSKINTNDWTFKRKSSSPSTATPLEPTQRVPAVKRIKIQFSPSSNKFVKIYEHKST